MQIFKIVSIILQNYILATMRCIGAACAAHQFLLSLKGSELKTSAGSIETIIGTCT